MQRGVQRTLRHPKLATAALRQALSQLVPVPRRLGQHRDEEAIEVTAKQLATRHRKTIHRQAMHITSAAWLRAASPAEP